MLRSIEIVGDVQIDQFIPAADLTASRLSETLTSYWETGAEKIEP